jgi:cardiolipin synthase
MLKKTIGNNKTSKLKWSNFVTLFTDTTKGYKLPPISHERPVKRDYILVGELDPTSTEFIDAMEAITGAPSTIGNQAQLLINGDQIFPAMLEAMRSATTTLNLLTFVYWTGSIAPQVAEAICERAKAGVRCNILLDAVGAAKIDRKLIEDMRECGAQVAWFRPPRWYNLTKFDNRTHRKILVVDGQIGFTGGVGIAEEWTGNAQDALHWRDTHLRLVGPVVRGLQGAFCENWLEATGEVLTGKPYLPALEAFQDGVRAQVTRSSAGKGDTNAETLFFLALAAAQKRIWLTTAYFAPRAALVDALVQAAERGVDVQILVPGPHIDKQIVRKVGRSHYSKLLKKGIKIYEYQPTMLHAKTMVVDSVWSTVGSINFDNRSFALNDEANVSIHDPQLAQQIEKQFELDLTRAKKFTARRWSRRGIWERVQEKLGGLVRREL